MIKSRYHQKQFNGINWRTHACQSMRVCLSISYPFISCEMCVYGAFIRVEYRNEIVAIPMLFLNFNDRCVNTHTNTHISLGKSDIKGIFPMIIIIVNGIKNIFKCIVE